MYVVVQRAAGDACYVVVRPEVAETLAVGDVVTIKNPPESWVKSTDRIVARFAAEHGGVYDPAAHQAALTLRAGRQPASDQPSPAELVGANLRRLQRLEGHGLVAKLAGRCWRVPSNLLAKLEAREKTHPRRRIQVDRVGPARAVRRDRGESRDR